MYLDINGKKYEIVITRKKIKNMYIRVKEDLKIHISVNKYTSEKEIRKLIENNYSNIVLMVERQVKKNERNEKTMILGKEVDLVVFNKQTEPELFGNKFYIKDKSKLDKYLKEYAFIVFKERLDVIYPIFNEKIPYPSLKIRKMTSRWGVCNRRDNSVTLNLELIKMNVKYLDYVIVHELSHFIHFDHSKSFWDTVSKYCKDYKIIRKEMRE